MRNLGPLEDFELTPADPNDPDPKAFHASVQIGSALFHVEVIRVVRDNEGEVHPMDPAYQDVIDALYQISTDTLSTIDYRGADHILCITPHSS